MDAFELVRLGVSILVVIGFLGVLYALWAKPGVGYRSMMNPNDEWLEQNKKKSRSDVDIERIKEISGHARTESRRLSIENRLYKAGYYSFDTKRKFTIFHVILCCLLGAIVPTIMYLIIAKPGAALVGAVLGLLIGYLFPLAWLDRQGRIREEDTMYFLPLVIEQISIGVSSALDIGPCIAHIIETAHERGSHNPVTEMLVHVEKLIRSGFNLQDALIEVGEASEISEIKHAFMFLAQCSQHGGEVSRQLQELADAVMVQRQVQVDRRITSLPVRATGPLATMFAGFFGMVFAGLFVRVASAFGG